ncbi:uncharacterized protein RCC_03756 [Ramularia collo-cygni]|uniref:RING-type domain-containing protein n=1 Tax=Ramularia collo-cygni TaxID=112498 RepID=A0A2D3V8U1_9PEZI|nr:uncharacterized protein RCC_03756 [Ramularia collo-cygni]CZT17919.1 uncharacterized protein RCC_03756 [Ramularia collo-cygni]
MPTPLVLRPAMSTSPMETLTTAQLNALHGVRVGDIILVEPESPRAASCLVLVYTIASNHRHSFSVAVKGIYEINPANLFDCQRYGAWNLDCMTLDWHGMPLEAMLSPTDSLTLNPTIETLTMRYFGGICLYQNCVAGLVRKSPVTVNDVHFRETESRAGREVWTLCPFCMGSDFQQKHECLVTCSYLDRYTESVMRAHLQAINAKRVERNYAPLPHDVDLVVLGGLQTLSAGYQSRRSSPTPEHTSRPVRRHPVPEPIQTRHSSRRALQWAGGPRLSSHSLRWFQIAQERVANDICGLCQQDYVEGERIVDLRCEHFYHERCLEEYFQAQRYDRKPEACPLCRRPVSS